MTILDSFKFIYNWFRQTGHTKLIKLLDSNNDICVIVSNQQQKKEYKEAYTLSELREGKLRGLTPKPMFIESNTLIEIFEKFDEEQNKANLQMEEVKAERKKLILEIDSFLHKQASTLNDYKRNLITKI